MKKNNVIWGVILIVIGILILLRSFDVIWFSWWRLFKLWPFLFVFLGISILPVQRKAKTVLYIISIIMCVIMMVFFARNQETEQRGWRQRLEEFIDRSDFRNCRTKIVDTDQNMVFTFDDEVTDIAIEAEISSGNYSFSNSAQMGSVETHFSEMQYEAFSRSEATKGTISLKPRCQTDKSGKGTIGLNEKFNYTYHISGDAEISMNLEHLKTDSLYINADANSMWTVTLSDKMAQTYVHVTADPDAKAISFFVPKTTACKFVSSTISEQTEWNGLRRNADGSYQSENFEQASSKIYITANRMEITLVSI